MADAFENTRWMSPRGEREVVSRTTHAGRDVVVIATDGERFTEILDASQLARQIEIDTKNFASRQKVRRDEEDAQAVAIKRESFGGFTSTMTPPQRARAIAALDRSIQSNGRLYRRSELIESRVRDGWSVRSHPTYGRILVAPNGNFLTEKDLSKIAVDYAVFLTTPKRNPLGGNGIGMLAAGILGALSLGWGIYAALTPRIGT